MRRQPENSQNYNGNKVFSADVWEQQDTSNLYGRNDFGSELTELSQYAATSIPQGISHTSRTARYSPSPHSTQYENSTHLTNSDNDPFNHSSYPGAQQTFPITQSTSPDTIQQNARYSEMPSPVRKTRLSGSVTSRELGRLINSQLPSAAPTNETIIPAQIQTPIPEVENTNQTHAPYKQNIVHNQEPQTSTPHETPDHIGSQQHTNEKSTPAYEPLTTKDVLSPNEESIPTEINLVEEEIVLSDFEQDFLEAHPRTIDTITPATPDTSIPTAPTWTPPALFTSGVPYTSTNNTKDFFSTPASSYTDEDLFYGDENERRETIQLDLSFLKNHLRPTKKKIIVLLTIVTLVVFAYLVVRPTSNTTSQKLFPGQEEPVNNNISDKTVVDSTTPQGLQPIESSTINGAPVVNPVSATAPRIEYDADGNIVYTSSNNNFDG